MFDSSTVSSINDRCYFNIAVGKLEMRCTQRLQS